MNRSRTTPAIVALAALLGWPDAAAACGCMGPSKGPPCQAVPAADAVFAGTVVSTTTREAIDADGEPLVEVVVRLHVERAFINSAPGPIELSGGRGSCDYPFRTGSRYLVYASKRPDGRLSTGLCSRTRLLSEAREDLDYLATLPQENPGVVVKGSVNEWGRHPAEEHGADYGPLKGVVVAASGATYSRTVVTDERGGYGFAGVPPGKLTVSVHAPTGLGPDAHREFDVMSFGCLQSDFTLAAAPIVTGTVQDPNGRAVAGVNVDAVAEELAGFNPPAYQNPVRTDERGVFTFERLPPGRYVFGINLTSMYGKPPAAPPVFLPGTTAVQEQR